MKFESEQKFTNFSCELKKNTIFSYSVLATLEPHFK